MAHDIEDLAAKIDALAGDILQVLIALRSDIIGLRFELQEQKHIRDMVRATIPIKVEG